MSIDALKQLVFLICFSISSIVIFDKLDYALHIEERRMYNKLETVLEKTGQHTEWSEYHKRNVAGVLRFTENRYGIAPEKILAVWIHESKLHPLATGRNYNNGTIDMGIGQINSASYRDILVYALTILQEADRDDLIQVLEKNSPYNITACAVLSALYLGRLYQTHASNFSRALQCYNTGGLVVRADRYVEKVQDILGRL